MDPVAIQDRVEACQFKGNIEVVRKVEIGTAIGDENVELACLWWDGSAFSWIRLCIASIQEVDAPENDCQRPNST